MVYLKWNSRTLKRYLRFKRESVFALLLFFKSEIRHNKRHLLKKYRPVFSFFLNKILEKREIEEKIVIFLEKRNQLKLLIESDNCWILFSKRSFSRLKKIIKKPSKKTLEIFNEILSKKKEELINFLLYRYLKFLYESEMFNDEIIKIFQMIKV